MQRMLYGTIAGDTSLPQYRSIQFDIFRGKTTGNDAIKTGLKFPHNRNCCFSGLVFGVSIDTGTDGRECNTADALLKRQGEAVSVTALKQRCFPPTTALPDWSNSMNHPIRGQCKARRYPRLPRRTPAKSPAISQEFRSGSAMNRTINPPAPQQTGVGSVDDSIRILVNDVADD